MVINGQAKISEVGVAIPPQIVTSQSLMAEIQADTRFGIPLNWVNKKIGIEERRFAEPGTEPSDLATEAAFNALDQTNINLNT